MIARRQLGSTGIEVSAIGLGTVKLGRNMGVKYPTGFDLPSDDQARALLDRARARGINLIDTAPAYGTSEERLGGLLEGQRDQWVLCTKAGEEFDVDSGQSSYHFSPGEVSKSLERSLERLRTDWLDVVLLHSDGRDEWILNESGAMEELGRWKANGAIRAIGISTKTPSGAMLALESSDVVMLTLNEKEQGDLPAVRAAHGKGVGVLIKKALASGHAAKQPGAVERAMRLCLSEPGVTSVIVGTINPAHLEENVRSAESASSPAD